MPFRNKVVYLFLLFFIFTSSFSYAGQSESEQKNLTTDSKPQESIIASKKAAPFTTAGFGPANMRRFGDQKLAYNFYGGKLWALKEFMGLGFIGEITSDLESSTQIGTSIVSSYFPFKTDISPYIETDIGIAFARGEETNVFGFSMGTSLGVIFFRSSTVQLNMQIKANILLDKLPDGYPGIFILRLGLLF